MPNGSLKCTINFDYQIDFGFDNVGVKFKIIKLFSKAVLDSSLYKYKKLTSDLRIK
jgi:hypothetical protein